MSEQKRVLRPVEARQKDAAQVERDRAEADARAAEAEADVRAISASIQAADAARDDILRDYFPEEQGATVIAAPAARARLRVDDEAFVNDFTQKSGE